MISLLYGLFVGVDGELGLARMRRECTMPVGGIDAYNDEMGW